MTSKILILITGMAFVKTCDKAVYFDKPQPQNVKNEKSFPKSMQHKYRSETDSSEVTITDKMVTRFVNEKHTFHINQLDSADRQEIKGDTVFYEDGMRLEARFVDDSVFVSASYVDTIFHLMDNNHLRLQRKIYYLNRYKAESEWEITRLERTKRGLLLSSANTDDDLAALGKLLQTSDTTIVFNPTVNQFKEYVKQGGFKKKEILTKLVLSN